MFLILHKNICCVYSLEVPQGGTSNEYPQHMFSCRNKKNIYLETPTTRAISHDSFYLTADFGIDP